MRRIEPSLLPKAPRPASFWRLLSCIRFDEVCVLQGAPILGACFAMANFGQVTLRTICLLIVGNLCLVAHIFVVNDWAGLQGDLKDHHRAYRTYLASGESDARMVWMAWSLLGLTILIFGLIGTTPLCIAIVIAILSAAYSLPMPNGKGVPGLNSALHLIGGTLHFLLGYASLAAISLHAVAIACYFGLVFAAGHLTHETRDYEGDRRNAIRTNAVAFGKNFAFLAGLAMFIAAYGLLAMLAFQRAVPMVMALAAPLLLIHLLAAWRAWHAGLDYSGVRRLQSVYRNIHALIGLGMLVSVPPW